jgi:hypothetical protein
VLKILHPRSWLLFLLLVALLVPARAASAQTAPPTLDAYQQLITEAYAAAQRSDRIGLDQRAEQLLAIDRVLLPDGSTTPVDNRWLTGALAEEPPQYAVITAQLGAILDVLGQSRGTIEPDALQRLEQVYEVPPFKSRALPAAWNRFWEMVGEAISDFFRNLFGSLPTPAITPAAPASFNGLTPTGWALLLIGLLLVVAIVIYAVRGIRRTVVAEARARAEADEEETMTASEAVERAHLDARSGDYRAAARHLYLSSLLWLEERGMLRYDRSRTNREYLRQIRGKPVHDDLLPVVETFESVWYGNHPLDDHGFREYERQVQALRARGEQAP